MQNVDVVKSHYLKGKQLFCLLCESNVVSMQEICPLFPASETKIEERISAVIKPQNAKVLLDKYEVHMGNIDLDHFRGGHLTFEGGVGNFEKNSIWPPHFSQPKKAYFTDNNTHEKHHSILIG